MDITGEIAEKVGVSRKQAEQATEIILELLHKRLVEYKGFNGDYFG